MGAARNSFVGEAARVNAVGASLPRDELKASLFTIRAAALPIRQAASMTKMTVQRPVAGLGRMMLAKGESKYM